MRHRSTLWAIIVAFGIGSTLLLLVGFGVGVADIVKPGSAPFTERPMVKVPTKSPAQKLSALNIVAIGDSLTRGTGDETGSGYVRRSISQLTNTQDKPVTLLNNLAINGQRADQLARSLDNESTGYILKQASVIMLTIGGNDLFQSALTDPKAEEKLTVESLQARSKEGIASLSKVLKSLREWNPEALIVYVGLYNPFSDMKEMQQLGNSVVQAWNEAAADLLQRDTNSLFVPVQDLFTYNTGVYLSSDHFHPNGAGYEAIATRIVQSLPKASKLEQ